MMFRIHVSFFLQQAWFLFKALHTDWHHCTKILGGIVFQVLSTCFAQTVRIGPVYSLARDDDSKCGKYRPPSGRGVPGEELAGESKSAKANRKKREAAARKKAEGNSKAWYTPSCYFQYRVHQQKLFLCFWGGEHMLRQFFAQELFGCHCVNHKVCVKYTLYFHGMFSRSPHLFCKRCQQYHCDTRMKKLLNTGILSYYDMMICARHPIWELLLSDQLWMKWATDSSYMIDQEDWKMA